MHPRSTRTRPLLQLKRRYRLFPNNILSPGFLRPSLFRLATPSQNVIFIDAVSCHIFHDHHVVQHDISFQCFVFNFWLGAAVELEPIVSVLVHALSSWSPQYFLRVFQEDLMSHEVISLLNSYYINGKEYYFHTINTVHHRFR